MNFNDIYTSGKDTMPVFVSFSDVATYINYFVSIIITCYISNAFTLSLKDIIRSSSSFAFLGMDVQ